MNGKFISIEGIEGAGKSTQMRFIQSMLEQKGIRVITTREPGGTRIGEQIRELLLTPREEGMSDSCELLLMFAARVEHIHQVIKPALERGDWVLSDRFVDATFAYQGGGRDIGKERIDTIADWSLQGLQTDLTLLFDLPVELGQQRVMQRNKDKDRFEQEKVNFFEKIRKNYLARAEAEPNRIKRIDASQSISGIQQQIEQVIEGLVSSS